jgi:hypothetical protein
MATAAGEGGTNPANSGHRSEKRSPLFGRTAVVLALAIAIGTVLGIVTNLEAGIITGLTAAGTLHTLLGGSRHREH